MKRNYEDPVYKEWRKKVYARDKFKCQMPQCGSNFRLQAHHIRKWSNAAMLRYDVDNGITLCSACHKSITGKETHYASYFTQLINKKR